MYIYIYIYTHTHSMCIYIYTHIYIYIYIYIYIERERERYTSRVIIHVTYGQFTQFHVCFCGLDPGNLKLETLRTNKQHICF